MAQTWPIRIDKFAKVSCVGTGRHTDFQMSFGNCGTTVVARGIK
jgi:hypothetical protein